VTGRVEGKVAFITGAARGQGRSHAVRLAEEGADIVALDLCGAVDAVPYAPATAADLAETVRLVEATGRRIISFEVDTRDTAGLIDAAAQGVSAFGRLDIVVANAGVCIMKPWDEITVEDWQQTISVNLTGTWNTVMATAPHLVTGGGGSIILTSSVAGLKGLPFMVPYVASKHGVTGLARAFAQELGKDHIRVNSIHPSGVNTVMATGNDPAVMNDALAANPGVGGVFGTSLGVYLTEPVDQSNAVVFLASDESRYITALALTVDAGNAQY
jgi:SDR family mycofactocin-dependent oxidoreductase